jgi:hypothetical protein
MGHFEDERIAIETRLASNWESAPGVLRTPIRYWSSNAPFVQPTTAWIALQIEPDVGRQVSLGDGVQLHRYDGLITIQVFTPEGTGPTAADQYVDLLDPIWRRQEFSYGTSGLIRCRTPWKRPVGIDRGWYQVNLKVLYQRDKQH